MIVLLDLLGGIGADSSKLVGLLGSAIVGLSKRADQQSKPEASERIKNPKTWVFDIIIVFLPVILGGDMTIAEVGFSLDTLSFSAGDGND